MPFVSNQLGKLRAALKPLAPHFAKGFLADYREFKNTRRYGSWREAVAAAKTDYEDAHLVHFRVERTRTNLNRDIRCEILHLCTALLGSNIEITDLGGATGYHGATLCREYPDIKYTIVETPSMVEYAQPLHPNLKFQASIPKQCDMFFTSCALPYVEDPIGMLREGFSSARKIAVLARNCFCDEEIFRVQTSNLFANGAGPLPPDMTMSLSDTRTAPRCLIKLLS
jgi:putative methyltransferase (TIGR04325 family)